MAEFNPKTPGALKRMREDNLVGYGTSIGLTGLSVDNPKDDIIAAILKRQDELAGTNASSVDEDESSGGATAKTVAEMDKDELAAHAKELTGGAAELNMRDDIDSLREEVAALEKLHDQPPKDKPSNSVAKKFTHLKNKKTGHVFVRSTALEKRGDMLPCDKDGNEA